MTQLDKGHEERVNSSKDILRGALLGVREGFSEEWTFKLNLVDEQESVTSRVNGRTFQYMQSL